MVAAIFGLLGVLVGAAATGLTSFLMAKRDEKLRRRAAVRLLCTDLHKVRALIHELRTAGEWGTEDAELPTGAYLTHSDVLAKSLAAEEWKRVEGAMLGVQRLERIRSGCEADGKRFTQEEIMDFRRIGAYVDRTIKELDSEVWAIDRSDGYQEDVWRQ